MLLKNVISNFDPVYIIMKNKSLETINPRGGGYSDISHKRRLGPFFLVQNSEFQYFGGFSEK